MVSPKDFLGSRSEVAPFAAYGLNLIAAVVLAGGIFVGREALCYCFTTSSEVVTVTLSLMIPFLFYQLGDSMQVVFANSWNF